MRIVIDLQGAQTESRFRGIGRYSLAFAQAIARERQHHDVIIALSGLFPETIEPLRKAFVGLLPQDNIRVWSAPGPLRASEQGHEGRVSAAKKLYQCFIESLNPDILHIASLFEGFCDDAVSTTSQLSPHIKVSVTLYDLIPLLNSQKYLEPNPVFGAFYRSKIRCLQKTDLLLAISEFSKQEALEHLEANSHCTVVNVAGAIDNVFVPTKPDDRVTKHLRQAFGIKRPFVLYTGGVDERKNLPRLIRAYAALPHELRKQHQLVFSGRIPEGNLAELKQEAAKAKLHGDELLFTGYISDEDLVQLYGLCQLYVFPSWHEGFGLPALEAMACGAPVLGANATSLPEVINLPEALFDPFSTEEITAKMEYALTDAAFRDRLQVHGLRQAERFSWQKAAQMAIAAFEKLGVGANAPHRWVPSWQRLINNLGRLSLPKHSSSWWALVKSVAGNHPQAGVRQIFVDVSELCQRDAATGVQRVTRSVVWQLLQAQPENCRIFPVYATTTALGYHHANRFVARLFSRREVCVEDELILANRGDIFLGLDLQHHVVIHQKPYYDRLAAQGVSLHFVVYDLLPLQLPSHFPEGMAALHAQWLEVISQYQGLACISQAVEQDLAAWLNQHHAVCNPKLYHFSMGAAWEKPISSSGLPVDASAKLQAWRDQTVFLMVGTFEPRKGHAQVLTAFEQLWRQGHEVTLVMVGQMGWSMEALSKKLKDHPEAGRRLIWLKGISDEYLEAIYGVSDGFIAASHNEGFGLPLLEAASRGLAIIARDIPIFREVTQGHAYFFADDHGESLATAMVEWLKLYRAGCHPISSAITTPTWQQSAHELLAPILADHACWPDRQLLVDVSEIVNHDAKTGIQRVVRSLLVELLQNGVPGMRVEPVYARVDQGYRYARRLKAELLGEALDETLVEEPLSYSHRDVFLGLDLQPVVVPAHHEFFVKMRREGVRLLFMVYDILAVNHPEWFPVGTQEGFEYWLRTVSQGDVLICNSENTAREIGVWCQAHHHRQDRPFKTAVVPLGADIASSLPSKGLPQDAEARLHQWGDGTTFLMVGTLEPRKGHDQVMAAFDQLWQKSTEAIYLVIVGKPGWTVGSTVKKMVAHPEWQKRLFWFNGISDEYLERIYGVVDALIAASQGEGFGLPLIEAARHGLAMVVRDIPVFREVAGDHAFYFQGEQPEALVDALNEWLSQYRRGRHPSAAQMPFCTWQQSAEHLRRVILGAIEQ